MQNVGANCKSFFTQASSEEVDAANAPQWFSPTASLSSCAAGSFAIGVYGRNGQGIDKLGVRCGVFSASFPKPYVFESKFPMDLIPVAPASLSRVGEFITCSPGAFGYQYVGMAAKDVQKLELDSVTLLLKIDGQIIGASSSDNFKNIPQWLLGIDNKALIMAFDKNGVTWKITEVSSTSKVSCQVMAYKEHQLTYITVS